MMILTFTAKIMKKNNLNSIQNIKIATVLNFIEATIKSNKLKNSQLSILPLSSSMMRFKDSKKIQKKRY